MLELVIVLSDLNFKNFTWCLKELRYSYEILQKKRKRNRSTPVRKAECWEPLWRQSELPL